MSRSGVPFRPMALGLCDTPLAAPTCCLVDCGVAAVSRLSVSTIVG